MGESLILPEEVSSESIPTHVKRKESAATQKRKQLESLAKSRLGLWVSQAQAHNPYLSISQDDLINWLVLEHEETLSARELEKIEKLFFNQLRFARQMIQKLMSSEVGSGSHEQLFMLYKKHLKPPQNSDASQSKTPSLTVNAESKKRGKSREKSLNNIKNNSDIDSKSNEKTEDK